MSSNALERESNLSDIVKRYSSPSSGMRLRDAVCGVLCHRQISRPMLDVSSEWVKQNHPLPERAGGGDKHVMTAPRAVTMARVTAPFPSPLSINSSSS